MLRGNAFLIMWHDIAPEGEDDYHHWHTKQHMVERVSHPGFRRSRRGVNWDIDRQRYFTLYEGNELATFTSEDYLASLNAPMQWTNEVAPHFRNFLRCACQVGYSAGTGVGGALTSIRGQLPEGCDEVAFLNALEPGLDRLIDQPKVGGLHVAFARRSFSDLETRETELRPVMRESEFDFVIILESYGLREIAAISPELVSLIEQCGGLNLIARAYDMAFTIEDTDIEADATMPRIARDAAPETRDHMRNLSTA